MTGRYAVSPSVARRLIRFSLAIAAILAAGLVYAAAAGLYAWAAGVIW